MEKTAPEAQVWTQVDAYGNPVQSHGLLARFLLLLPRTFHGQKLRLDARRDRTTGVRSRAGERKQEGAPRGAFAFFRALKTSSGAPDKIWRPAVSGTGGIQDDRVAGRQKPKGFAGSNFVLSVGWIFTPDA